MGVVTGISCTNVSGALSSPMGIEGLGFFRSAHQPQSDKFPHLQLNFRGLLIGSTSKRQKINLNKFNMKADVSTLFMYVCMVI